jgi:mono/diheme cytochrome c family protein
MRRFCVLLFAASAVTAAEAAHGQTPNGAYTEQQAVVGEAYFRGYCLECHGPSDMANDTFKAKWHGRSAFDLFERLRTSMPDGAPGSLPRQTYADIVAYFLKLNGAPVGSMTLSADSVVLSRTPLILRAPAVPSPSR